MRAARSVPVDVSCGEAPTPHAIDLVEEWSIASFADGGGARVLGTPMLTSLTDDNGDGDIDLDDVPDLVFISAFSSHWQEGGVLRAVSGDGRGEIWSIPGWGLQGTGSAAVGDVDGDGQIEVVALSRTRALAWGPEGGLEWTSGDLSRALAGAADAPAVADLDGDGSLEVVVGSSWLNGRDGAFLAEGSRGIGRGLGNGRGARSFAVDLDGDGVQEVVVGDAAYRPDGTEHRVFDGPDAVPAVADLDGDGVGDLVAVSGGKIYRYAASGALQWSHELPCATPGACGGPPTLVDVDGDVRPEVAVHAQGGLRLYGADGSLWWVAPSEVEPLGKSALSAADLDGDGAPELVYLEQGVLRVVDGVTGADEWVHEDPGILNPLGYPLIADVDGDGRVEVAYTRWGLADDDGGVVVLGDPNAGPGRKVWSQEAALGTNVLEDGRPAPFARTPWGHGINGFGQADLRAAGLSLQADPVISEVETCGDPCAGTAQWGFRVRNTGGLDLLGPRRLEWRVERSTGTPGEPLDLAGPVEALAGVEASTQWVPLGAAILPGDVLRVSLEGTSDTCASDAPVREVAVPSCR